MDEKLIADYQFVFNGRQGQNVLEDLKEMAGIDKPFCEGGTPPDERTLLYRAVWCDVYNYIKQMADGQGD